MTKKIMLALAATFTCAFASAQTPKPTVAPAAAPVADYQGAPDAVISTKSLSDLPKDIVSIPLLKDVLSEDFVFYYRDGGENWLSVRGALARIAYEKDTDWPLRLMRWFMNGPAEVALWKDQTTGRLSHAVVVIDQSGLKQVAQAIAKSATTDTQLRTEKVGERTINVLKTPNETEIYFTTDNDRLVIFTDKMMQLPLGAQARSFTDRAKSVWGLTNDVAIYGPKLGSAKHEVSVSASYLSFGYQSFFDTIKAFKFRFTKEWDAQILTTAETASVDQKDWSLVPRGAGLCVAVPFNKKSVASIVKASNWLNATGPTATACWYDDSKFYAPLVTVRGKYDGLKGPELKATFEEMIGAKEAQLEKTGEDTPATIKWLPKLAVKASQGVDTLVYTREVGGRYGLYPVAKSAEKAKIGSKRFFRVKLATTKDAMYFSPDDTLVDLALKTNAGKFPSISASLPKAAQTPSFILSPDHFSKLAKNTVLDSLPAQQEQIFRTAVSRYLLPNLEKFGKRPLQAATIAKSAKGGWSKVEWTTNAAK